jgi:UDP-glucose 4-epimerase
MIVLVTGAFGNIGTSTVTELLAAGHQVRCFDLPTRANRRRAARFGDRIRPFWGDIRRPQDLAPAVTGCDAVIHLAFIIPKMSTTRLESESVPELAHSVNVDGTCNLLDVIRMQARPPRLIFASSMHVYGQTQHLPPPRRVVDPVAPMEHYARHKIECEEMVRSSGLRWTILRFAATFPLALQLDPGMFDVPLDNRIEFVHTRDVGLAVTRAIECDAVLGKTLHIGGGRACQYLFGEMADQLLGAMGVGMLPTQAFSIIPFGTDWLDTDESEALLHYQRHDLRDYVRDMVALLGPRRQMIRLLRPFVRAWLLQRSLYYRRTQPRGWTRGIAWLRWVFGAAT